MEFKNYMDDTYYVLSALYFIVCFVLLTLVLVLDVGTIYFVVSVSLFILLSVGFYCHFYRSYTLERKELVIKCGFITKKIAYKNIKKCYITRNNRISYATSKKRIAVKLKNKEIFISPLKMDEFLMKLINKGGK